MFPESSLAKDQCCICQAMLTVSSKVVFPLSLIFSAASLLSVSGWTLEDFDDQGRGRSYQLSLGLSVLNVISTVILRPFQAPASLTMSLPTFSGHKPRRPRTDMVPTSLQMHLRWIS